ncbi:hypothetical protein HDU92_002710 [Lobulomyces angularis]|nr:hypothetical protein HDU92_002710 [Lobulomyces angularis]
MDYSKNDLNKNIEFTCDDIKKLSFEIKLPKPPSKLMLSNSISYLQDTLICNTCCPLELKTHLNRMNYNKKPYVTRSLKNTQALKSKTILQNIKLIPKIKDILKNADLERFKRKYAFLLDENNLKLNILAKFYLQQLILTERTMENDDEKIGISLPNGEVHNHLTTTGYLKYSFNNIFLKLFNKNISFAHSFNILLFMLQYSLIANNQGETRMEQIINFERKFFYSLKICNEEFELKVLTLITCEFKTKIELDFDNLRKMNATEHRDYKKFLYIKNLILILNNYFERNWVVSIISNYYMHIFKIFKKHYFNLTNRNFQFNSNLQETNNPEDYNFNFFILENLINLKLYCTNFKFEKFFCWEELEDNDILTYTKIFKFDFDFIFDLNNLIYHNNNFCDFQVLKRVLLKSDRKLRDETNQSSQHPGLNNFGNNSNSALVNVEFFSYFNEFFEILKDYNFIDETIN